MLGSSLFQVMDDDPFFVSHREHMMRMNQMFESPFAHFGMGMSPNMLTDGRQVQAQQRRPPARSSELMPMQQQMDPFGMFNMGFNSIFGNMQHMMRDMHQNFNGVQHVQQNPNAHTFTQSSFMSYSNTGEGAPKVYQASSSTRTAPGGIKETKKTVRDSERGLEKMAIGHHIHDRGHIKERSHNIRTGDRDENEELINLDETESHSFNREWEEKTKQGMRGVDYGRRGGRVDDRYRPYGERLALPAAEQQGKEYDRDRKGHDRERKGHTRKVSYRDRE